MNWYWWVLIVVALVGIGIGLYFAFVDTSDIVFYSEIDQKGTSSKRYMPPNTEIKEPILHDFDFVVKSVKFNKKNYKVDFVASKEPASDANPILGTLADTGNVPDAALSKYVIISKTS